MIGEMREMSALRFEAGEQVGAESSEIPGTGIGLAVTNQLIEGMAGKVGFESTMGQGTTF
jgi:signal transduction histidine kinase